MALGDGGHVRVPFTINCFDVMGHGMDRHTCHCVTLNDLDWNVSHGAWAGDVNDGIYLGILS